MKVQFPQLSSLQKISGYTTHSGSWKKMRRYGLSQPFLLAVLTGQTIWTGAKGNSNISATMTRERSTSQYVLGSSDAERERLIKQASWLSTYSERFLREAGIGTGQRVLDIGSGVGDVALLAARLVGPSGEVIGVERDPRSIARARTRVSEAGLRNVTFIESDVANIPRIKSFDAAIGRYILMFITDPVPVLRAICRLVRPGGAVAFQEPSWGSFLHDAAKFPLWSAAAALLVKVFQATGTNTEIGPSLCEFFQEAGLPEPAMRTDVLVEAGDWMPDILQSLRPQMARLNFDLRPLGDFDTLSKRLSAEIAVAKANTPVPSLVSAWCLNRRD